jgi:hypothetical protein
MRLLQPRDTVHEGEKAKEPDRSCADIRLHVGQFLWADRQCLGRYTNGLKD